MFEALARQVPAVRRQSLGEFVHTLANFYTRAKGLKDLQLQAGPDVPASLDTKGVF